MDGSRNPTVFAASSFAIAEDGAGCSPGTRVARSVTNGGPGAAALEYLDEDEEAEDPAPTAEGDDGKGDSSKDEKPAPEDDGDEHQAKRQACLARVGALVGNVLSPPPATGWTRTIKLFNIAHLQAKPAAKKLALARRVPVSYFASSALLAECLVSYLSVKVLRAEGPVS
jgi:hypothetical protein